MRSTRTGKVFALGAGALALACPSAGAVSAPDAGRAFEPPAPPPKRYAIKAPSGDPRRQVRIVGAHDGTKLYTETWLPAAKAGAEPPARVPVVLVYTPYAAKGVPDYNDYIIQWLVPRGYAVTSAHVRGSGGSGGCIEQTAALETADGARIVEDAGEKAPWASGRLGMYGLSYPGGTQLMTAMGPDRARLQSLRALVAGSPNAGTYEFFHHDGVPELAFETGTAAAYWLLLSTPQDSPEYLLERSGCQGAPLASSLTFSGDYTPYFQARDFIRRLGRLRTPILMWHGTADLRVNGYLQSGLFDALPDRLPHKGVFGVHDHNSPHDHSFNETEGSMPQLDWERADWEAMVVAWYERWLRRRRNLGVTRWPAAQVQGTDGQWRTASTWPRVPGPPGTLALGAGGALGTRTPSGSSTYLEAPYLHTAKTDAPPGTAAIFTTQPLPGRLEILGQAELDLWVTLRAPDSHVTARLEVLGRGGTRTIPQAQVMGARSARHLDPWVNGRFRQGAGRPPPVGTPFKMTIRFNPADLVVPPGGRLRLTIAGTALSWDGGDAGYQGLGELSPGPTMWSGFLQPVTLSHSCAHRSLLRFAMPGRSSRLIDIREKDQSGALGTARRTVPPATDGGGIARSAICGD